MNLETTHVSRHANKQSDQQIEAGADPGLSSSIESREAVPAQNQISDEGIRFRCPHCQKLYRTNQDVFTGALPEFDCEACEKSFQLTHEINAVGLYLTKDLGQIVFNHCPKCAHLKPQKSDECPSCGVFASKYEAIQKVQSPALFELNQVWQKAVHDFNNDQLHQDFLNCCQKKLALNFAFQKYSDLQKTIGFDSACEKYMKQIELRLEQQLRAPFEKENTEKDEYSVLQIVFIAVGVIGTILLIYNKIRPTFPNLTGLVVAITILSFGLGVASSQRKKGIKL